MAGSLKFNSFELAVSGYGTGSYLCVVQRGWMWSHLALTDILMDEFWC